MKKKSGTPQKDKEEEKFNPSSRLLPGMKKEQMPECDVEIDLSPTCMKSYPYPKKRRRRSNDKTLRKLAEKAREEIEERLEWREQWYQGALKWALYTGIIIGILLGAFIGGVIL